MSFLNHPVLGDRGLAALHASLLTFAREESVESRSCLYCVNRERSLTELLLRT